MRHPEPAVRGYAATHPPGLWTMPAAPGWHLVLLPARGALHVRTADGAWVAPRDRAVVVPAGPAPRVELSGRVAVRALYLDAARVGPLVPSPRAIAVRPLLRELVLDAIARAPLDPDGDPRAASLLALVVEELRAAPELPLHLPWPRDPHARALADAVVADPARPWTAAAIGAGLSRRTLERRFVAETGLGPAAWQRRARLSAAVALLAGGRPVTEVALAVGYATPSAFTAAFRRELGRPPTAGGRAPEP